MAQGAQPPIGEKPDFTLVEVDAGHAVFEGTPEGSVYNPIGSVHGGYAATLLDSACGVAVHQRLSADQAYTTLELKIYRSDARRVGKECVRTCRSRWSPYTSYNTKKHTYRPTYRTTPKHHSYQKKQIQQTSTQEQRI